MNLAGDGLAVSGDQLNLSRLKGGLQTSLAIVIIYNSPVGRTLFNFQSANHAVDQVCGYLGVNVAVFDLVYAIVVQLVQLLVVNLVNSAVNVNLGESAASLVKPFRRR